MEELAEEALELINNGLFNVTDLGPLHGPIRNFTVRRDENLNLIIETEARSSAQSSAVRPPLGSIRLVTEKARLQDPGGAVVELEGLVSSSVHTTYAEAGEGLLREKASMYRLTVKLEDPAAAAYTIDWLENLPRSPFMWPDSYKATEDTAIRRTFGPPEEALVFSTSSRHISHTISTVKLIVDGWTLYVCALNKRRSEGTKNPGCVIYIGAPNEEFRKKVRVALSFTLGLYLVDLGTTLYSEAWTILAATARSAYSLGMRAFDLGPTQLAPLSQKYRYQITPQAIERAVNCFVAAYEGLDLGNLSWAYWHACTATTHIAPVQFGAAIESLQRAYLKTHPDIAATTMPADDWKLLRKKIIDEIAKSDASEEAKRRLSDKLNGLNRIDQRALLKAVFAALDLRLGKEEDEAWKRRNNAAHGMPVPEGHSLAAIRDTHLLQGVFHRMLLRMTGAADSYVDYATEGLPNRPLTMPPAEVSQSVS